VVKINHIGFGTYVHVWNKVHDGTTLHNFNASCSLLPTLPNTSIYIFEEKEQIPRVGDIWIPR
jgi:hypothetical protein